MHRKQADKTMKTSNNTRRLWLIYGAFVCIVLFCATLFFLRLVSAEDDFLLRQVERSLADDRPFVLGVTDLPCAESDTAHTYVVHGTDADGAILAHVSTFDMALFSSRDEWTDSPMVTWAVVLQVIGIVSMLAIIVLVVVLLANINRAIRSGRVFQWRKVWVFRSIGILMFLMTLAFDTSLYLERRTAFEVLQSTDWVPQVRYTIHFTRLFFALVILFVGELIHIGNTMQQEQDLTI